LNLSPTYIKPILSALLTLLVILSIPINSAFSISNDQQTSPNPVKVFVMYAASLIKIFENSIGPSFEKKTAYTYTGEGRGSVQIANMIIDGQRRPDVFVSAGTIPIMKLIMNDGNDDDHDAAGKQAIVIFLSQI
jgi:molybdate/tungstate transport system substrate-binding protein